MPVYEYHAINSKGKKVKGTLDAESVRVARQRLRAKGIFPTEMSEAGEAAQAKSQDIKRYFQSNRISVRELSVATRQLSTLVGAGLPLVSALQALSDQTDSLILQRIVIDIREEVEQGSTLASALGKYPKTFSRLYANLVNAGETSGALDVTLINLADYLEAQVELRRKINSALLYPVLMLFVCTAVIAGLFIFVIPSIVEIYKKQNVALPVPTQVMIGISNALIAYWYVIILGFISALLLLRWYYRQAHGRARVDDLLLKLPIYGLLYTKVISARVAGTLGALLSSGVGLLKALEITRSIVGNVHAVQALDEARDGVREGRSLASELAKSGRFPSMLSHMVAVGEKSGELESMLVKAGDAYEKDVNSSLEGLTSLLEPLLMIVVGSIVLAIVLSVLLPMVDLINVVGG